MTLPKKRPLGRGCARGWEGTQPRHLTLADQRDVPYCMMCSVMTAERKEKDVRALVVMAFISLSNSYTDWGSGWTPACWWEVVNTFLILLCLSIKFLPFLLNCSYLDPGTFSIFSSPGLSVLLWVEGERPAGWASLSQQVTTSGHSLRTLAKPDYKYILFLHSAYPCTLDSWMLLEEEKLDI